MFRRFFLSPSPPVEKAQRSVGEEIGAMPAILLEPAELKSDRDETTPVDSSASFLQRQFRSD